MRYETEWEGMRLVIESRPEHFQVFVYNPDQCEVLYTAKNVEAVKSQAGWEST